MLCECQRNIFNCEENVQRFLGVGRHDGSMDLAARDELIANLTPLIERIVSSKLQGKWRQDRPSVVQETFLKLCDPAKLRTWLESPSERGSATGSWLSPITPPSTGFAIPIPLPWAQSIYCPQPPVRRRLTDCTNKPRNFARRSSPQLSEFELEWQLVFCMKYSYLEPCISDIARAVKVAKETVFFRLKKIKARVACRCAALLSPAVAKAALVGICHPVDGFDRFERDRRDQINDAIRTMLTTRPLKEQFIFYMKYSPLAAEPDLLAVRVGEDKDTVRGWLVDMEEEIKRLCKSSDAGLQADRC